MSALSSAPVGWELLVKMYAADCFEGGHPGSGSADVQPEKGSAVQGATWLGDHLITWLRSGLWPCSVQWIFDCGRSLVIALISAEMLDTDVAVNRELQHLCKLPE